NNLIKDPEAGKRPFISGYAPRFGEERVLVGKYGSGTINFADPGQDGKEISLMELADAMLELQKKGCPNINLISPSRQIVQILEALFFAAEKGLKIPLVYNSDANDSLEVIKQLEGLIDIYLPVLASSYSKASVLEMHRQVGDLIVDGGLAYRGVLVRHLVLPNDIAGSEAVIKFIANDVSKNTYLSIPCQNEGFKAVLDMARAQGLHRGLL
ncbi:MAG: radical SAM protein, partial [Candidatus Margulisbacteria bacterium]|nr:radical SAM protein [Candidatus Margulisiibacteriota bacterium]